MLVSLERSMISLPCISEFIVIVMGKSEESEVVSMVGGPKTDSTEKVLTKVVNVARMPESVVVMSF
jgi:hypothetical protein